MLVNTVAKLQLHVWNLQKVLSKCQNSLLRPVNTTQLEITVINVLLVTMATLLLEHQTTADHVHAH